jgi:pilus assembly protein Flp/PilA
MRWTMLAREEDVRRRRALSQSGKGTPGGEARMLRLYTWLYSLRREEEGQTLVEYALIIALVSVALIAGLEALAVDIGEVFTRIGTALDGA